jgi:hypothetical protein
LFIITRSILEEIVEESIDKAQIREYLKSAPEMMSGTVLTLADMSLSLTFPTIETEDFVGNTFGENISHEPDRITPDNWTRNVVKVIKNTATTMRDS